ncbi:GGDEF domain-containing protein [Emcibacter sp. SYSU 3D8]|uniref:GGDEF domain-containing protein n=1 Tax=Emcibacter sp. SYSU 3D8 TaxID=3133969 RepID=UPI0031FF26EE
MFTIALFMSGMYLTARRETSTRYWAIAAVLLAVGAMSSFPLAGTVLASVGIWLAVTLVIAGGICWWWGLRVFFGRSVPALGWWIITANSVACALIFAVTDAAGPRIYNFVLGALVVVVLVVRETLRGDGTPLNIGRKIVVLSYLTAMAALLARAAYFLVLDMPVRPMTDNSVNVALLYFAPMVCVLLGAVGVLLMYFERTIEQKEYLATHDDLTRLRNRRALANQGRRALETARDTGHPLSLLLIDIDHFKDVNDTLGHAVGDRTLCAVAEALTAGCRRTDLIGRQGGEEFCIVCPDTDEEDATRLGERLLGNVRAIIPHPGHGAGISISVGVATAVNHDRWETLLRLADQALYAAKDAGRDRVAVAAALSKPQAYG